MARGPSGPAYRCLSAQFAPVVARGPSSERALRRRPSDHLPFVSFAHPFWRAARAGQLFIAFLPSFPPFWRAARVGQLIICRSAQFAPVLARGSSGPANHCLASLYRARAERSSLSFARPERVRLSFALMPDLRCSPTRVKSTPWAGGGGGGGDALLFYEGLQLLALHRSTPAKRACVANILNASVNEV